MTIDRFCELCGFTAREKELLASYLADEKLSATGKEVCRLCFEAAERPDPLPELAEGDELAKVNLLSAFYGVEFAQKIHERQGIPPFALENGMRDIALWARRELRDKGVFGLKRGFHWTNVIYRGTAIRLGRLECNLNRGFRMDELRDENGNVLITKGEPVIGMHIPADGPLDIDDCIDSMHQMAAYFDRYLPDFRYKGYVIDSWLLDPVFEEMLGADSNIVKFQKLGIHYHIQDVYDCTDWIWGARDPEKIAEPSTLQKKALEFLKSGKQFKLHGMYIPKEWIVKE